MALRLYSRSAFCLLHRRLLSASSSSSSSGHELQPNGIQLLREALPGSSKFLGLGFSDFRGVGQRSNNNHGVWRSLSTEASTEATSAGEDAGSPPEYPLPAPPPGDFDDFPDANADFDDDYVEEDDPPPDPELDLLYSPSEDE